MNDDISWIYLLSIARAQNQTNQILKQQMEEAKIKKFDLDLYYSLKAQNEKVAEEYLKYWEQVAEEEKRKAEEAEKQRKIKEQEADERRAKYVISGVVLFIVLLIATILCVQNC